MYINTVCLSQPVYAECSRESGSIILLTNRKYDPAEFDYIELDAKDAALFGWHSENFQTNITIRQLDALRHLTR